MARGRFVAAVEEEEARKVDCFDVEVDFAERSGKDENDGGAIFRAV